MESLSAYARQFLSLMEKPDVDHIEGLSPLFRLERNLRRTTHVRRWERLQKFTTTYVSYLHVLVNLVVLITTFARRSDGQPNG